jgi:hypothetical protein
MHHVTPYVAQAQVCLHFPKALYLSKERLYSLAGVDVVGDQHLK